MSDRTDVIQIDASSSRPGSSQWSRTRSRRATVLVTGLLVFQILLFGQSITGRKVLLPLDILATPNMWMPKPESGAFAKPHDLLRSDLILSIVPWIKFATMEVRAGRLPLWNPMTYAGTPMASYSIVSPYNIPFYFYDDPIVYAWTQVLRALVGGVGMYLFLRRAFDLSFWPAVVGAWCFPMCGYLVQWQGCFPASVVSFFPWMMLGTALSFRSRAGGLLLAGSSAAAIYCGQADIAALTLLVTGLYALCLVGPMLWRRDAGEVRGMVTLVLGWTLGIGLATPYLIPLLDYTGRSARLEDRANGQEDRSPGRMGDGLQIVLPNVYGTDRSDSYNFGSLTTLEGMPSGYAGLVATLFLAPLAFASREHHARVLACLVLIGLGLSWNLNVQPMVALMRLPYANMLSYNRATFASAFALITLSSVGLEVLGRGQIGRRVWYLAPALLTGAVLTFCVYHSVYLPGPVGSQLSKLLSGDPVYGPPDVKRNVSVIQANYRSYLAFSAALSLTAGVYWVLILCRSTLTRRGVAILVGAVLTDLLVYAWDVSPQTDRAMYYPRLPALNAIASAPVPGRILGVHCLPPNLNMMAGLFDVRGYDGVDPKLIVELVNRARIAGKPPLNYAQLQWFTPDFEQKPDAVSPVPPILNMLNVRYFILRGTLPTSASARFQAGDYLVVENPTALPRVYIPTRTEVVSDAGARLDRLAKRTFNPRKLALVNEPANLPDTDAFGAVRIVEEVPTRVTLEADMQTPGLVVLADQWDKGWTATLDGRPVPILHANHAIRGVVVPPGRHEIVYSYFPKSLKIGLTGGGLSLIGFLTWAGVIFAGRRDRA